MKLIFPYSLLVVLFILSTCFTTTPEKPAISDQPEQLNLIQKTALKVFAAKEMTARLTPFQGNWKISVVGPLCTDKNQFPIKLEGVLESDFSTHAFVFTGSDFGGDVNLKIDHSEFTVSRLSELNDYFAQVKTRFCATRAESFEPTKEALELITGALEKAVPECHVKIHGEKFICELPVADPLIVAKEVDEFRRTMISRWSRQPYIIARRASVAGQLAHLMRDSKDSESSQLAMQKFCKLLKISVHDELPLIISSPAWKNFICDAKENWQKRMNVALFGLKKATDEMNILKNLFDQSSHVGLFTVHIPKNDLPKNTHGDIVQDFTVTITPDSAVFDGMATQLSSFLKKDTEDGVTSAYDLCWHPLFAKVSPGFDFEIAKQTQIFRSSSHVHCLNSKSSQILSQESMKYLTSSLASETQFVMTNGRSRLVRLPAGRYTYKVTVPQELSAEGDSEQEDGVIEPENLVVSVGQLNWEKPARARKIVRK